MNRARQRPITLVTGFLGSGKTTLLRRFLAGSEARDTAVLVNEFGEVGLDHHLLQRLEESTVLLGNGCVCCTLQDDLVRVLKDFLDRDQRGDIAPLARVLIETTGLADPAPLLFTVETDAVLQHHFRIAGVVVTVDAVNGQLHLDRHPASWKQVAVADEIVVTKADLAPPEMVAALLDRLHTLNPAARLTTAVLGDVDPSLLLQPRYVHGSITRHAGTSPGAHSRHAGETRAICLSFDRPLDWIAWSVWLSMLLHARGEDVLRVKGLLNVGATGPVVFNSVQHLVHPPEHLASWPGEDQRSHLVFILHAIAPDAIVRSLQAFQRLLGAHPTVEDVESHL